MQVVLASPDHKDVSQGELPPWAGYMYILPADIPVPTTWSAAELTLLGSTSLESAVAAKLELLAREFDNIRIKTSHIAFWEEVFRNCFTLRDWIWLDAVFRSRSFELPDSGESLVPCLDLVNHSKDSTTYFRQDSGSGTVHLVWREGCSLSAGEEVTINYGKDKSAAEMLFNYGFIDPNSSVQGLVLPMDEALEEYSNFPSLPEKLRVFNSLPKLELEIDTQGVARWSSPFVNLMCLNKEDGLEFKVTERNGQRFLSMLWQGADVTSMASMVSVLTNVHPLRNVFQYRAISIVADVVEKQLKMLRKQDSNLSSQTDCIRAHILQLAFQLRTYETNILEKSLSTLKEQMKTLSVDENVMAFLNTQR